MLHSTICWFEQWALETICPIILRVIWNLKRRHSTHLSSTGFVEFCIDSLYKLKGNERETHTHRIRRVRKDIWKSYRDEIWAGGPYSKQKKKEAEFPLSQSGEALILNCFMDITFLLRSRYLFFWKEIRRLLDVERIFFLSKNVTTVSVLDYPCLINAKFRNSYFISDYNEQRH